MALVYEARTSGISGADIMQVLGDELEFAAEMVNTGHTFVVTLMDLGDLQLDPVRRPQPERLTVLEGRGVMG